MRKMLLVSNNIDSLCRTTEMRNAMVFVKMYTKFTFLFKSFKLLCYYYICVKNKKYDNNVNVNSQNFIFF